jgi:hypothetical protein
MKYLFEEYHKLSEYEQFSQDNYELYPNSIFVEIYFSHKSGVLNYPLDLVLNEEK